MKSVSVYTEAAAFDNGSKGSYAAVILLPTGIFELAGRTETTTLNAMRITAAVESLNAIPEQSEVRIFSRSNYIVRAVKLGWLTKWRANDWQMGKGTDVENVPLWQALLEAIARHENVTFAWSRYRAFTLYNEHADALAWEVVTGSPFAVRPCTLGERKGASRANDFSSVIF